MQQSRTCTQPQYRESTRVTIVKGMCVQVKPPRLQQSVVHFECKLAHSYPVVNKCAPGLHAAA